MQRKAKDIPGLLLSRAKEMPEAVVSFSLSEGGHWSAYSWEDFLKDSLSAAVFFSKLGLRRGDILLIMANSSKWWDVVQMAGFFCGAIVGGISPYDTKDRIHRLMKVLRPRCVVLQEEDWLDRFSTDILAEVFVVCIEEKAGRDGIESLLPLVEASQEEIETLAYFQTDKEEDLPAIVVSSSGTTGPEKIFSFSHSQVMMACERVAAQILPSVTGGRTVCWLPLSNLFQRMVNFVAWMKGFSIYYVSDPRALLSLLPGISPDVLVGVPRFFEKFQEEAMKKILKQPLLKILLDKALALKSLQEREEDGRQGLGIWKTLALSLLDRLVLRRVRMKLGKNVKFLLSGSAPISQDVLEWYRRLDLPIFEAYGISENILPIAMNTPTSYRMGSVGRPVPGNEVKISREGEILVKGQCISRDLLEKDAYRVRLEEGFLRTGDLGRIDEDGFLFLLDRKDAVFKTSTGHRVYAGEIESTLSRLPYVAFCVVVGRGRKIPVAVIDLKKDFIAQDIISFFMEKACQDISNQLAPFPPQSRPVGVVLLTGRFSPRTGELTETFKVKRYVVETKYKGAIDRLYSRLDDLEFSVEEVEENGVVCTLGRLYR